ncbi:hypothetical protein [Pseudobacter ginsenosidimutans]|uniref:Uncharacterized protein n=1 Tax=Pseudobacter ginsenosidimutans TaxID=661488 RepID=A0A4Q7MSG3_9BACT|nr:hypothetical protein [Pseudobacter ginsenosidimutans]QEC41493.1 hypothetical protein FSB84_07210 [Pseudobacter ginsenosidimutans]RZS71725.1 hypothetical protein EV199_3633 [Pseudobacter ginsenosidimutans]
MHFHLFQFFQFLSLAFAIWFYRSLKSWSIGAFLPLLVFIFLVEIVGNNFEAFGWDNNYFIYNIYLILSTPFWLYLFRQMLGLSGMAIVIFRWIAILCMSFMFVNYFYGEGVKEFNSWSLLLLMILTIVFSCLILFRLSVTDIITISLYRHPFFWINAGNLLFALVTLVLLGLQPYIRENDIQLLHKSLYYAIIPTANIILYTSYCYGFYLCRAPLNRSL